MSKKTNAAKIEKHDDTESHTHDCGHDHSKITTLPTHDAAFMSLVYRILRDNQELKVAYEKLFQQTQSALLACMENRDPYTYGHCMRVMQYTMMIGKGAGLKTSELQNLEWAAKFHDIGKLGVPDCVLLKPGKLDPQETKVMQTHPIKSAEIMGLIDIFKNAVPGMKHHHERFDGTGYPSKLLGKEIPLEARIILVADTFDAMTSTRPYRKALPVERAYQELETFSGTQFDPEFVKIFLKAHKELMKTQDHEEVHTIPLKKAA